MRIGPDVLVVIPAYNEALSVATVVAEVAAVAPAAHILVVDDASTDGTAEVARTAGAEVVRNPVNLGVGGAMRVGFRHAEAHGFQALVQVDGDGQHDPAELPRLVAALGGRPEPMVVIGSRFGEEGAYAVPRLRRWAMRVLARYVSAEAHVELTDVTSGFRAHNRAAIELFAATYPPQYLADTVESVLIAVAAGGHIVQVPVRMRARRAGTPSQNAVSSVLYLGRVSAVMLATAVRNHLVIGRRRA